MPRLRVTNIRPADHGDNGAEHRAQQRWLDSLSDSADDTCLGTAIGARSCAAGGRGTTLRTHARARTHARRDIHGRPPCRESGWRDAQPRGAPYNLPTVCAVRWSTRAASQARATTRSDSWRRRRSTYCTGSCPSSRRRRRRRAPTDPSPVPRVPARAAYRARRAERTMRGSERAYRKARACRSQVPSGSTSSSTCCTTPRAFRPSSLYWTPRRNRAGGLP
jgi:hypothetical protein